MYDGCIRTWKEVTVAYFKILPTAFALRGKKHE
jgi:hypothetical protein